MKKTCENCKHKDTDYSVYPCMDCFHKSKWEEWQDTNYYPTTEDLIIAELEKIKEEIQGLIDFEESCCGNATLGYSCLRVINESIEAIRGKSIEKENKQ